MKKEFKLKKGFNWCSVALATLSLGIGIAVTSNVSGNDNVENASQSVQGETSAATTSDTTNSSSNVTLNSQSASSVTSATSVVASSASSTAVSTSNSAQPAVDSQVNSNTSTATSAATNVQSSSAVQHTDLGEATSSEIETAKSAAKLAYTSTGVAQEVTVKSATAPATATSKNGWVTDANSSIKYYYVNGQKANGYLSDGSGWYLFKNGQKQSDVQKWAGTYYYFDHRTYLRVDNSYVKSNWGDWYLFGSNGRILTDVQKWAGSYYYFDHSTYLRVDNSYVNSNWGDWYLFGSNGRILTDVQKWAGSYYYFDHNTYLKVSNKYVKSNWGDWYLFTSNGRIASGWMNYGYSSYYFNPSTYLLEKITSSNVVDGVDSWTIGDPMRPQVAAVDVSSYQSSLTQANFNKMKSLGVKTVIVKLTEGTYYASSVAANQIRMAKAAGLNVAVYDYVKFNSTSAAKSEAAYMVNYLKKNNIAEDTTIIADMEDTSTYSTNVAGNLNAFWSVLSSNGYAEHVVYTYVSYKYRDQVVGTVGKAKTWIAQYPYSPMSNTNWNSSYGAWQISSQAYLPGYSGNLDVSVDYDGLLTNM